MQALSTANHAPSEEEIIEEEYRAWIVNTVILYDHQKSYGLEWPSLTVQWLPGVQAHPTLNEYCIQSMLLGTHTTDDEPNYLLVADVALPLPQTVIDVRTTDENGHPRVVQDIPSIHYRKRINHDGEVNRARYMPQNSSIVATKSPNKTVFVFNLDLHPELPSNDVKSEHECHGHTSEGYGICWNPKKQGLLLSGSLDGSICAWDMQEAGFNVSSLLRIADAHANGVEDVDWHKHHDYMFGSVGNDSMLALYDVRKGSQGLIQRVRAHDGDVHAIAFNPENEHLFATGGADNVVNLWDLRKIDEKLHSFEGHNKEVLQVSWSPYNEAILGSCGADRRVNIWDVNQIGNEQSPEEAEDGPPELYFVHGGHKASVSDFSWNMNEGYEGFVASVAEGNVLQVWQPVSIFLRYKLRVCFFRCAFV
jgi:histone-binding protein RBBP4